MAEQTPTSAPSARKAGTSPTPVKILIVLFVIGAVAYGFYVDRGDGTHTQHVTRADLGAAWPLTVDGATIGCAAGRDAYVQVGSIRYALNGTAESDGYDPVDPIWADDPTAAGLKVTIGVLRNKALALC